MILIQMQRRRGGSGAMSRTPMRRRLGGSSGVRRSQTRTRSLCGGRLGTTAMMRMRRRRGGVGRTLMPTCHRPEGALASRWLIG